MKKLFALLFAAIAVAACNSRGAAPPAAPAAIPAKVIQVAPASVPIVIEGVGQVEGSKEVEVRSRVNGILKRTLYKEGDVVKAGAPLFQIDPEPFENALAQARSQLVQATARAEQAKRERDRLDDLVAKRAISQKEYDDAGTASRLAEAAQRVAESRVRDAELNLSYTNVTAPVGGITGRALHSDGSLISATGPDGLLTTLTQVDPIWVRFSLSESDLAKLPGGRLNRTVSPEIRLVLPDGTNFAGKGHLNFTATQIDTRLATLQMRAEFANAGTAAAARPVRARAACRRQAGRRFPRAADRGAAERVRRLRLVLDAQRQGGAAPGASRAPGSARTGWCSTA